MTDALGVDDGVGVGVGVPFDSEIPHTRLLKFGLEIEPARAFWRGAPARAEDAFDALTFGDKSLDRVRALLRILRERFERPPQALPVLRAWTGLDAPTRALVCHWHTQLSDPLYRAFTGELLPQRRDVGHQTLRRDEALAFVTERTGDRLRISTRVQLVSKLCSAAREAGLLSGITDPRQLQCVRPTDDALTYLLYLLRGVGVADGAIGDTPYLRSLGLTPDALDRQLRGLRGVGVRRQGALLELDWAHADLLAWARDGLGLSVEETP
ncbi:MAG: DUF1819 domain-containing protein [Deltaproteobacteria bacterium]|nr:DUF1819 domain-containing protein [Deltaproteobacteria bacterium]